MDNISKGKQCYASHKAYSDTSINGPVNNAAYTVGGTAPVWWMVDLGDLFFINTFSMRSDPGKWSLVVEIEISKDKIKWEKISSRIDYYGKKFIELQNVDKFARYVRVNFVDGTSWVTMYDVQVYGTKYSFIIQQNNYLYSIKDNFYDISNKNYIPLQNINVNEIIPDNMEFDIHEFIKLKTINDETFKPIDKFDKFKLVVKK